MPPWWRGRGRGWRRWSNWGRPYPWCWRYWGYWNQTTNQANYQTEQYWSWQGQGWSYPQYGVPQQQYQPYQQPNDVIQRAKEILSKASVNPAGYGPYGGNRFLIIYNGNIIGWLWENVPLRDLEIGEQWSTPRGVRVTLFYKGKPIGFMWV